jgi:hypothetical protein
MPSSAIRTFTDPDAYFAAIRDAHAEGVITGRGNFRAESTAIRLDRLSLQRSAETLPRIAYSAVDPKVFCILFATHPAQQAYISRHTSTASNSRRATSSCSARGHTIGPRPRVNGVPSL